MPRSSHGDCYLIDLGWDPVICVFKILHRQLQCATGLEDHKTVWALTRSLGALWELVRKKKLLSPTSEVLSQKL